MNSAKSGHKLSYTSDWGAHHAVLPLWRCHQDPSCGMLPHQLCKGHHTPGCYGPLGSPQSTFPLEQHLDLPMMRLLSLEWRSLVLLLAFLAQ